MHCLSLHGRGHFPILVLSIAHAMSQTQLTNRKAKKVRLQLQSSSVFLSNTLDIVSGRGTPQPCKTCLLLDSHLLGAGPVSGARISAANFRKTCIFCLPFSNQQSTKDLESHSPGACNIKRMLVGPAFGLAPKTKGPNDIQRPHGISPIDRHFFQKNPSFEAAP